MGTRTPSSSWDHSTRPRPRSEDAFWRAAVSRVLDSAATNGLPPTAGGGHVAVIRGFERDSRLVRDALRAVAGERGHQVLDVPSVPGFGEIPPADDVRLVVVARRALLPVAGRCAAFWRSSLLGPAVVTADPEEFTLRPEPALAVATAEGHVDSVAFRLELAGQIAYRASASPLAPVSAIAMEPTGAGLLVEHGQRGEDGGPRVVDSALTLHLIEPATGTIDTHAQLFPAGTYTISVSPRPFHRIVVNER